MNAADFSSIRIRPELRAAQVERASLMTPALTIYFDEKYDLGTTEISSAFQKMRFTSALAFLFNHRGVVLEVPEPLWLRFLPKTLLLAAVWKISGVLTRRRRIVATYAIENNELANLISPRRALPSLVLRGAGWVVGGVTSLLVDRIAYGSTASRSSYQKLPGMLHLESQIIEELPARRDDFTADENPPHPRAMFVGELDHRKGLPELLRAWARVEQAEPSAHLTIVGSGPMTKEAELWAASKPDSRTFAGFVQHQDLPPLIARSTVLVAPSVRDGRWREQIGLPIVEALSAGLTVVTTDETGLATWLRDNGHTVVPLASVRDQLPGSLVEALTNPLDKVTVTQSLPRVAGRISSDQWLHSHDA